MAFGYGFINSGIGIISEALFPGKKIASTLGVPVGGTFTRASGATVPDYLGVYQTVGVDVPAVPGARYEAAILQQSGMANYTTAGGATISAGTATLPTNAAYVKLLAANFNGVAGDVIEVSISATVMGSFRLYAQKNDGAFDQTFTVHRGFGVPQVYVTRMTLTSAHVGMALWVYAEEAVSATIHFSRITKNPGARPGFPQESGWYDTERLYTITTNGAYADRPKSPYSKVSCIGDSFTAHQHYLSAINSGSILAATVGAGIGGNTLTAIEARFAADVVAVSPGVVVVQGGINDIVGDTPITTMLAAVTSSINQAIAAGIKVALVNVAPWKNHTSWTSNRQALTLAYNTGLSSLAASYGLTVVDIYTMFSVADALSPTYDSGDGLHLNVYGDWALGLAVASAIEPLVLATSSEFLPLHPFTDNRGVREYTTLPARENSTARATGYQMFVNKRYYTCTTAGTTAGTAPTFSTTTVGQTVVDGTVTWTDAGHYTGPFGVLLEEARTNYFLNSAVPVTQNITTSAQAYTVSVVGSGSVTLSGTATGVVTSASPLTVTATVGTLTCTVAGTLTHVDVQAGAFATSNIITAGATATRAATNLSVPNPLPANDFTVYVEWVPIGLNPIAQHMMFDSGDSLAVREFYLSYSTAAPGDFFVRRDGVFSQLRIADPVVGVRNRVLVRSSSSVGLHAGINGIFSQLSAVVLPWTPSGDMRIGARIDGSGRINGTIPTVIVFKKPLTDAQCLGLSNGTIKWWEVR